EALPEVWAEGPATRVADQLANCFAADRCEFPACTESTSSGGHPPIGDGQCLAWEQHRRKPGEGLTVSPDHLLFWDAPLYGDWEPMEFMSATYHPVFEWVASPIAAGIGTLRVTVVRASTSEPLPSARVTVGGQEAFTDTTGVAFFVNLSAGQHFV